MTRTLITKRRYKRAFSISTWLRNLWAATSIITRKLWAWIFWIRTSIFIFITVRDILITVRTVFSRIDLSISAFRLFISIINTNILQVFRAVFTVFSKVNFSVSAEGFLRVHRFTVHRTFTIMKILTSIITNFTFLNFPISTAYETDFYIFFTVFTGFGCLNLPIITKSSTWSHILRTSFTRFPLINHPISTVWIFLLTNISNSIGIKIILICIHFYRTVIQATNSKVSTITRLINVISND